MTKYITLLFLGVTAFSYGLHEAIFSHHLLAQYIGGCFCGLGFFWLCLATRKDISGDV